MNERNERSVYNSVLEIRSFGVTIKVITAGVAAWLKTDKHDIAGANFKGIIVKISGRGGTVDLLSDSETLHH